MIEIKFLNQPTPSAPSGGCSVGSCGSHADQLAHLPEEIRERVHNHPCFSEEAHHYYARMHVAVAPACNIQCHYCNRKYDCSNESRPGVVSELLTPTQAVKKVLAVAAKVPQMSVLGIAGPGDPLANPERTFATFRALTEQAPDIKLCLSTNGLALPDYVDELTQHNIDHVTLTINCVDPVVGAKIYPWIFWNHRRIRGMRAAEILIARQQQGLEMLVERGVLVKVNSVMIPGVNDHHLPEVSRIVKQKGAFLHNVMPLIAEAEHGTYYGLTGQRGPSAAELQTLQDECGGDMNMMRHCRQCRADAVGLLGEDRGAEFTMDKVEAMDIDYQAAMAQRAAVHRTIETTRRARQAAAAPSTAAAVGADAPPLLLAVATAGGGLVNQHFGHAQEFLVYEVSPRGTRLVGHRKVERYCTGNSTCGDHASALEGAIRALEGCTAVLCAQVGPKPWTALEAAGIEPIDDHAMELIDDALPAAYATLTSEMATIEEPPVAAGRPNS